MTVRVLAPEKGGERNGDREERGRGEGGRKGCKGGEGKGGKSRGDREVGVARVVREGMEGETKKGRREGKKKKRKEEERACVKW